MKGLTLEVTISMITFTEVAACLITNFRHSKSTWIKFLKLIEASRRCDIQQASSTARTTSAGSVHTPPATQWTRALPGAMSPAWRRKGTAECWRNSLLSSLLSAKSPNYIADFILSTDYVWKYRYNITIGFLYGGNSDSSGTYCLCTMYSKYIHWEIDFLVLQLSSKSPTEPPWNQKCAAYF